MKSTPKPKANNKTTAKPQPQVQAASDIDTQALVYLQKTQKRQKLLALVCILVAIASFSSYGLYSYHRERTASDTTGLMQLIGDDTYNRPGNMQNITPNTTIHRVADGELPPVLDEYLTLYNRNRRMIGWIRIEGTVIDYPVLQTVNNEYYLDRDFYQEFNRNGSIFMDYRNTLYPRSTNLIIYGHRMRTGQMFGHLQRYENQSYFEEHPLIHFDTIYEKGVYQVMYTFRSRVYNTDEIVFKYYQFFDVNSAEEFYSNMQEMAAMSYYDTGVTATFGDQLLTLSTCDDIDPEGRFVVVAKRIE
ncbi:MAG: class B sortase [Lachnospiraceae bacterium]|jgi:sortase B|nr:class B sortase [Lachnospiraceae bacterium]